MLNALKLVVTTAALAVGSMAVSASGLMPDLERKIVDGTFQNITSILVQKKGDLVYERYFGNGKPTYQNNTRSVTKTITSYAVGAAIQQGVFGGVDDPVWPLFGDYMPAANGSLLKQDIRIKDLLTMSSALDCNDNDPATPGYEDKMHEHDDWTRFVVDLPAMAGWSRGASGLGPFRYCTAGVFLLGQAIELAAVQSLDAFVDGAIFGPLGIDTYEWYRSPIGEEQAGGGLTLMSRDLLRLGQLALADGVWNGRRILPAGWIEESSTAHRQASETQGYGYLWWVQDFASKTTGLVHPAFLMSGNGGNKVVVLKEDAMVVVITSENYNTRGMHQQTDTILQNYILPSFEAGAVY